MTDLSVHVYSKVVTYSVGKRRALELHRANNIKSSLQKYITKSNTAFYGQKLWTTKQIMVRLDGGTSAANSILVDWWLFLNIIYTD